MGTFCERRPAYGCGYSCREKKLKVRIEYNGSCFTKNLSSHLGIEPRTFGLEVQRAILCANGTPNVSIKSFVRSGIRTHAHRSGLRPERSALDLSAILTV